VLFELGNVTDYNLATADRATHPYLYQLAEHYDVATLVRGSRIVYDSKAIPYKHRRLVWNRGAQCVCGSVPAVCGSTRYFRIGCRTSWGSGIIWVDAEDGFAGSVSRQERSEGSGEREGVSAGVGSTQKPGGCRIRSRRGRCWRIRSSMRGIRIFMVGENPPKLVECGDDDVWMAGMSRIMW